jgi:hypothetical protein
VSIDGYFANHPVKSSAVPHTSPQNDAPRRNASARLEGRAVSKIEKLPPDNWVFQFGNGVVLSTQSQWRLLSPNAILLTSEDDGQQYGVPGPVDAVARIRELLESRVVSKVKVDQASADFNIYFDDETVLQIVNLSSGYEAWTLDSEGDLLMVGRNGSS